MNAELKSAQPDDAHSRVDATDPPPEPRTSLLGNIVRGALMGAVETVPGVSGGTVALVVGIYTRLLDSASHLVSGMRRLITGPNRRSAAAAELRLIEWKLIIPVLIGMVAAILTVAGPIADLVETQPELTRAAFFGMVLASISVPLQMAGIAGVRWWHLLGALAAGVVTWWLVSLPPTTLEPSPLVIVIAAAVAVSALLLPGLSGSFLLLTFGLYAPTLRAVDERDFGYLGLFALGMVIGVVSIVKGLEWLLHHRRRVTLIVLTGVMVGAMRALWPWQTESRELLAPDGHWPAALGLAVAGAAVVLVLTAVNARQTRTRTPATAPVPAPE